MEYKKIIIVFFLFCFSTLVSMHNQNPENDPVGVIYNIIQDNLNDRENKLLLGQQIETIVSFLLLEHQARKTEIKKKKKRKNQIGSKL